MRRKWCRFEIPGMYRVHVRPDWKTRTLPQLIATIKILRGLAAKRRKYDALETCIEDTWEKIMSYEYRRVLYVLSQAVVQWCRHRLALIARFLDEDTNFMKDTIEYRMRVAICPSVLEMKTFGRYWMTFLEPAGSQKGNDFGFFLPESVVISLYSPPDEVAAVIFARNLRNVALSDYERMFLHSRVDELNEKNGQLHLYY